jgi:hypothetical protein
MKIKWLKCSHIFKAASVAQWLEQWQLDSKIHGSSPRILNFCFNIFHGAF